MLQDKKIGIWGASYGGATAGLALGYENIDEKIDFLIMDCPVSSMKWWCGNLINKLKLGFTYQDADVASGLKNVKTPVLIINSKSDMVTPYFMGKDIYDAIINNNKGIWTVDDSEHCEIWLDYNQEYGDKIDGFLKRY
ncbi:MAG: alpha/beta hydrolase [Tissierella sp.]|nr:alpha/beta hydrolase [Tissierella sp.]